VVVRSYYGDCFKVNPQLLHGSILVHFGLDTLPVHLDQTVDCSRPGADCELVTLVAIIFRVLHKVMVMGSLTVPGAYIGQTHSSSLEAKSTITAWNLAPRRKSVKQVTIVTGPPYPHPFWTLSRDIGFHHQLVRSSKEGPVCLVVILRFLLTYVVSFT
jgi:hypothetical protein